MANPENGDLELGRLEHALGFLLLAGWRHANAYYTKHFRDLDMTPATYGVLSLVSTNPGCAIGDVGRAMGIAPNNIARLVDRLHERGLVEKSVSADDARIRSLQITPAGTELLRELDARHTAYEDEFHAQIGQDRLDALRALLRPFARNSPVDTRRRDDL
jgi:DNA-binding MarR family transcriptional regulator